MSAVWMLAALAVLLPFEPMSPIGKALYMELGFLELAAAVLLGFAGLFLVRDGFRRVPLGMMAALFLAVAFASTLFASEPQLLPFKASLRVLAGVIAFLVTSQALRDRSAFETLFAGFATAGLAAAAIALLERALWPEPLALLSGFREQSFEVGGQPRVSASFAYPNLLGGFLAAALPLALYFRSAHPRVVALAGVALFLAILLTHSRGALLGALAGTAAVWLLERKREHETRYMLKLHLVFAAVFGCVLLFEPAFRWRATGESDRGWYQARIEPKQDTLSLAPGELTETPVTIENTGKLTWANEGVNPIHLSYRWFEPPPKKNDAQRYALRPLAIEGERTRLDEPLEPGERRTLPSVVRAPERDGRYLLVWDMVHEETTWFSDKVGLNSPVGVTVGKSTEPALEAGWIQWTTAWRPGRLELWTAALRLFRSSPWLGVGPDNFRWLYGPAMGRTHWDTRTYANSLYLETLADMGILGLIALALVIGKAVRELNRSLDAVSVALLASIAALIVHGLFDYLLEATPMYLTFWMVLGAASARIRTGSAS